MAWFGRGKQETEQESAPAAAEQQGQQSFFQRMKQGLVRTNQLLNTDIRDLFKQEGRLVDEELLDEIFAILIRTDMGGGPAGKIRDRIGRDFRARLVHVDEILEVIKEELKGLVQQPEVPLNFAAEGPTVIMVVGVNGSGKTTSIAKLANMLTLEGKKVVLGAADTFRAAAVEQLTIWAGRIGCDIVTGKPGADPASVAYQTVDKAVTEGADVCIVDTAGRLQTQVNLMKELEKIRNVMAKRVPEAPHETLLVLDSTAGQNGISQAKGFSDAAHCTGIVLTKLDGTAKGGVVVPIREQFNLPVKYIGLGEKEADLALFNADQFVDAMFADVLRK
jgi:fused signal recognition particle receptor